MRRDKVEILTHLIWTTWDREPFITPEIEPEIYNILGAMVARHNARVLKIGGVADHVHLLIQVSSTTRLCDLVKDAKGASSRFAGQHLDSSLASNVCCFFCKSLEQGATNGLHCAAEGASCARHN